jgi:hypothetical protein
MPRQAQEGEALQVQQSHYVEGPNFCRSSIGVQSALAWTCAGLGQC